MFENLQYAYLIGDGVLFLVWMTLFLIRKDLRREILMMSLIVAPLGPISEIFYTADYWKPTLFNGWRIGVEDVLFGFFIGGISGVLYEELFGKKFTKRKTRGHPTLFLLYIGLGILWMIGINSILGLNSIYASIFWFMIIAATTVYLRHDLLKDALLSGVLLSSAAFILYTIFLLLFPNAIQSWWMMKNISGILITGIPLEELMWAFTWGLFAGPAYEFTTGLRFAKSPITTKRKLR